MTSNDHDSVSLRFLVSPRWIGFHLLVAFGIVLMVSLGFWQLRRLDQRRVHNAVVTARYDTAPEPVAALLPPDAPSQIDDAAFDDLEWRPVTAVGRYLPGQQVQIINRSQDGAAGWQALSPLRLEDGRILLVNRGFVPLSITTAAEPTDTVEITGHLRRSQTRQLGGLSDPATGPLDSAQRIDIERLSPQFDGAVIPMYVELSESSPDGQVDGLPDPVPPPDISEGPHLSYAIQWFCFSAAVAGGWVLAVRNSINRRRSDSARHGDVTAKTEGPVDVQA